MNSTFCRRSGVKLLLAFAGVLAIASTLNLPSQAAEGQKGGSMVVVLPGDPPVINSAVTSDTSSNNLSGQIYSTIVRLDNSGKVVPYLAKSWEISPDGKTYTFKFFDNIKWHDGKPFTAEDVAWSLWNVNKKYNGPASGLLKAVESITATDKLTAVFKLSYAFPPLLRGLAYFNSSTIVPKHLFEGSDPRKNPHNFNPIGTGPFIFKEYKKGSHVIVERNPNFHLKGRPYLDRLVFQIIPNKAARVLALEKGDVDFIPYYAMSLSEVSRLETKPEIKVDIAKRLIAGEYMAFLNNRNAPLKMKEVRQALYYGLDRNELLKKAAFGYGKVSAAAISSLQQVFYSDKGRAYPYDPARAEKMLDDAGYPRKADGKRFTLRLSYDKKQGPLGPASKLMRIQLAKIGVGIKITAMDSGAWRDSAFKKWDFDITLGSFSTGPDPAIGTERLYVCRNIKKLFARNASGYCNPKLDELFGAASKELNEAKRIAFYREAMDILTEDVPHLWLWDRHYPLAFKAGLTGLPADPTQYGPFDAVSWKQKH